MLPNWKYLQRVSKNLKLEEENYFELAEEYVELSSRFYCESFVELVYLWLDMVFYPLYLLFQICMQEFSIMSVMSVAKTYQLWIDWFRLQELIQKIDHWKLVVRCLGGPWITSNDITFHVFVYADGMQRIKLSRTTNKNESSRVKRQNEVRKE